jgi:O-antigen/teichoic acid export membrane protein
MVEQLTKYIEECELYEKQRIFWLRISGFVAIVVLLVIAEWHMVDNTKIEWLLVTGGLTLIVIWWYWTMMIIRRLLLHKKVTARMLLEMSEEFSKLAENFRQGR